MGGWVNGWMDEKVAEKKTGMGVDDVGEGEKKERAEARTKQC